MRAIFYSLLLVALASGCGDNLKLSAADPEGPTLCPDPLMTCDGECINPLSDNDNCGECGETCDIGLVCAVGQCALGCPEDLLECESGCVDPSSDIEFCGATGSCSGESRGQSCDPAFQVCSSGRCQFRTDLASCAAIKEADDNAVSGNYWVDLDGAGGRDPFLAYCDMTTDGGGWILLGTIYGGDEDNWNMRYGNWANEVLFGSPTEPFVDFKSQAWFNLDVTDAEVMIERRYDDIVRAQTRIKNACLHDASRFNQLFADPDDRTRCPNSSIETITAAADTTGLSGPSYVEGSGSNALGSGNGFCWTGGDNQQNTFRGHLGWNGYSTCVAIGHSGFIALWSNGWAAYEDVDITHTNWLKDTDTTKTAISIYAR